MNLGDIVLLTKARVGVVRYVGSLAHTETKSFKVTLTKPDCDTPTATEINAFIPKEIPENERIYGIEIRMSDGVVGNCDGVYRGIRYFKTASQAAIFVKHKHIRRAYTAEEILEMVINLKEKLMEQAQAFALQTQLQQVNHLASPKLTREDSGGRSSAERFRLALDKNLTRVAAVESSTLLKTRSSVLIPDGASSPLPGIIGGGIPNSHGSVNSPRKRKKQLKIRPVTKEQISAQRNRSVGNDNDIPPLVVIPPSAIQRMSGDSSSILRTPLETIPSDKPIAPDVDHPPLTADMLSSPDTDGGSTLPPVRHHPFMSMAESTVAEPRWSQLDIPMDTIHGRADSNDSTFEDVDGEVKALDKIMDFAMLDCNPKTDGSVGGESVATAEEMFSPQGSNNHKLSIDSYMADGGSMGSCSPSGDFFAKLFEEDSRDNSPTGSTGHQQQTTTTTSLGVPSAHSHVRTRSRMLQKKRSIFNPLHNKLRTNSEEMTGAILLLHRCVTIRFTKRRSGAKKTGMAVLDLVSFGEYLEECIFVNGDPNSKSALQYWETIDVTNVGWINFRKLDSLMQPILYDYLFEECECIRSEFNLTDIRKALQQIEYHITPYFAERHNYQMRDSELAVPGVVRFDKEDFQMISRWLLDIEEMDMDDEDEDTFIVDSNFTDFVQYLLTRKDYVWNSLVYHTLRTKRTHFISINNKTGKRVAEDEIANDSASPDEFSVEGFKGKVLAYVFVECLRNYGTKGLGNVDMSRHSDVVEQYSKKLTKLFKSNRPNNCKNYVTKTHFWDFISKVPTLFS